MKISNKILSLMLIVFVAIITFSCSNSDDNKEVVVPKLSILDIVKADSNFSILAAALKKTSLDIPGSSPLSSPGSYTVFAPTDAAFVASTTFTVANINALDPATVADVTTIANLKKILQNHILGIGTKATDLLANGYLKTFAPAVGSTTLSLYVNKPANDVLVNGGAGNGGAKVTTADIQASNGIVHIIDSVLKLPTILDLTLANTDLSTLVTVVSSTSGTYGDQSAVKAVLVGATNASPLTLFAPTNAAFMDALGPNGFIPAGVTDSQVSTLLLYHVAAANNAKSALTDGKVILSKNSPPQSFKILLGSAPLRIEDKGSSVTPVKNISYIKITDIQAINGVIHTIDKVLQPVL